MWPLLSEQEVHAFTLTSLLTYETLCGERL